MLSQFTLMKLSRSLERIEKCRENGAKKKYRNLFVTKAKKKKKSFLVSLFVAEDENINETWGD